MLGDFHVQSDFLGMRYKCMHVSQGPVSQERKARVRDSIATWNSGRIPATRNVETAVPEKGSHATTIDSSVVAQVKGSNSRKKGQP